LRDVATILFDVGNTLTWIDLPRAARLLAAERRPRPLDRLTSAEAVARRVMYGLPTTMTDRDRWSVYVDTIFARLGLADDPGLPRLRDRLFEVHAAEHLWRHVVPGTAETLERIRDRGFRLGVVSNSDGRVPDLLDEVGLAGAFEVIIDSQLVGVEKPDPRIFAIALERLAAPAESAIYVGDYRDVDVVGARRAGLRPVLLDPLELEDGSDFPVIRRLEDLEGLLPVRARGFERDGA
jgi:putative hydrolase of the HAD superfamily